MEDREINKVENMEKAITICLRVGVTVSSIIILLGLVMFLVTGNSGYADNYFPSTPVEIFKGFIALKSYAIILTGLIILILTPVLRVGVSIFVFVKEKDYLYAKISSVVLAILIISFLLGKVE
jgi:uncharacterized membrane protein